MELWATVEIFPVDGGEAGEPRAALARDISMEGIGVLTSLSPRKGTKLVLSLPRSKTITSLIMCNVVFCGSVAHGIFNVGCNFESEVTSEQFRLIQEQAKAVLARLRSNIID